MPATKYGASTTAAEVIRDVDMHGRPGRNKSYRRDRWPTALASAGADVPERRLARGALARTPAHAAK
jgi:hypothetical protein